MDLDDDTYQDIIDKIGLEINEILKGMKKNHEMKNFMNDINKIEDDMEIYDKDIDEILDAPHETPLDEYYINTHFEEESKRLANSSHQSNTYSQYNEKDDVTKSNSSKKKRTMEMRKKRQESENDETHSKSV
jgi:uncharacterized protein YoxC